MNKVVVISVDALFTSEIERFRTLPRMGELLRDASWAADITCVYPTLTYPCHACISTGCYPDRNHITHNETVSPGDDRSDWYWYADALGEPTVIDYAKAKGLTTACVTWPVMGGCGADYAIGEIWAPTEEADPTPWFERANSLGAMEIFHRNKHRLHWMKTPAFDDFAVSCACDIIREHAPDLLLVHFSYLDHQRHKLGTHSPQLEQAYHFIDQRVGMLVDAVKERGLFEQTNFVILGDHGHLNCDTIFHINQLLVQRGLITLEGDRVTGHEAYVHSCALSAQLFLGPDADPDRVLAALEDIRREYPQLIERIFSKAELKERYRLEGDFAFMLEAGPGVTFGKSIAGAPLLEAVANADYKYSVATHGHMPEKGDKPPFIVSGPAARKNVVLQGGHLVDEAPTILRLLGIDQHSMDGHALDPLLH